MKMIPKKSNLSKKIYQIKITLKWSKPPIWRRFQVEGDVKLGELHDMLQTLMGWWDCHLHQFRVGDASYTDLSSEDIDTECFDHAIDENKVKLSSVLKKQKQKIIYEYDFGDGWEHELLLEKIVPAEEGVVYPVCLDGKRRCPPEDCGGMGGYENLLEILKDRDHPEYEEWQEWLPEGFESESFELDEINEDLRGEKNGAA